MRGIWISTALVTMALAASSASDAQFFPRRRRLQMHPKLLLLRRRPLRRPLRLLKRHPHRARHAPTPTLWELPALSRSTRQAVPDLVSSSTKRMTSCSRARSC